MDVLFLSRLQFAFTAGFHFIFVLLTLGLSVLIAIMQTIHLYTKDDEYLRMAKFWGKLFIINFVLGVVTGITLEFQFGTNWAEYSKFVGDIFGPPLAIEATVAFFLESVFLGLWIFGWGKISPKLHTTAMWIVAIATNLSALWILIANGWMQAPVGYVIRNGRAEMVDFWAVVTNSTGIIKFFHSVFSGYVVAGFFVMGVSCYHFLKKNEISFFKKSFTIAAFFSLASTILVALTGDMHGKDIAHKQPAKLAAMESLWETKENAPMYILTFPHPSEEKNIIELIKIDGLLSWLAGKKEVIGLKAFPKEDRPPVLLTFISFRLMFGIGVFLLLLSIFAVIKYKVIETLNPYLLRIFIYSIPLPYIAAQLGWIVAEVGRQPWIVYGIMRTSEGVSKSISIYQVWFSFIGLVGLYGVLAIIDIYLLFKYSRKGPQNN